jgi:hypothetical protein
MPVPLPMPLLDEAPPPQPGTNAQPPTGGLEALQPKVSLSADVQTTQVALEAAAGIGNLLDLLGEMFPTFSSLGAAIQDQLRAGLKTALEQGLGRSEPASTGTPSFAGLVDQGSTTEGGRIR